MSARKLESHTLDFKAPARNAKDTFANLTDAAVCFANAAGGTIVLGVADDVPGADAIVGTDLSAAAVRRAVYERTSPGLDVAVSDHAGPSLTTEPRPRNANARSSNISRSTAR
jgi:ATP-dependent DNA helicase RecG